MQEGRDGQQSCMSVCLLQRPEMLRSHHARECLQMRRDMETEGGWKVADVTRWRSAFALSPVLLRKRQPCREFPRGSLIHETIPEPTARGHRSGLAPAAPTLPAIWSGK